MPTNVGIYADGLVLWAPPVKFKSTCQLDVTLFPFDEQVCSLRFASWIYDGLQVDIINRSESVNQDSYTDHGEWEIIETQVDRNVQFYACCVDVPFPEIRFTLHLKRRTLFYMYNIIIPCIMLSILTLMQFWLPCECGEKVTLGLTVVLAYSVFSFNIGENMPETSDVIPLIAIYIMCIMSLSSISVTMSVIVLNLRHAGERGQKVPPWLHRLAFNILSPMLCFVIKDFNVPVDTGRTKCSVNDASNALSTYILTVASQQQQQHEEQLQLLRRQLEARRGRQTLEESGGRAEKRGKGEGQLRHRRIACTVSPGHKTSAPDTEGPWVRQSKTPRVTGSNFGSILSTPIWGPQNHSGLRPFSSTRYSQCVPMVAFDRQVDAAVSDSNECSSTDKVEYETASEAHKIIGCDANNRSKKVNSPGTSRNQSSRKDQTPPQRRPEPACPIYTPCMDVIAEHQRISSLSHNKVWRLRSSYKRANVHALSNTPQHATADSNTDKDTNNNNRNNNNDNLKNNVNKYYNMTYNKTVTRIYNKPHNSNNNDNNDNLESLLPQQEKESKRLKVGHSTLDDILKRTTQLINRFEKEKNQDAAVSEWHKVARVFDQLFFWIVTFLTIGITCGMLYLGYRGSDVGIAKGLYKRPV